MDTTSYKSKISLKETDKLTNFIENICQEHNITYYYGTISVTIEHVMNIINSFYGESNSKILFGFEQCVGGVSFFIECEDEVFLTIPFDKEQEIDTDSQVNVFLISKLSDKVLVSKEGKRIELLFFVNGIEPELLLDRQEKIKQFNAKRIYEY